MTTVIQSIPIGEAFHQINDSIGRTSAFGFRLRGRRMPLAVI
ncbi:hypothetical protein ACU5AY_11155 [Rhizobium sp. PAMB 3174]